MKYKNAPKERHGVADEKMCNVPGHQLVDTLGLEPLVGWLVDRQGDVVVFKFGGTLRQIATYGRVPALPYPPFAGLHFPHPTLATGTAVHRGRNNVPSTI